MEERGEWREPLKGLYVDHLDGRTFLTYSRPSLSIALTWSSNRGSFRLRIHSNMMPRTARSIVKCFAAIQKNQLNRALMVRCLWDLHSRPVVICSLSAAISADSLTRARSTFLDHFPPFLTYSSPPSSSSSFSSCCWCSRNSCSAASSSLIGLRTFMGPSVPLAGRWNWRCALGEDSDVEGLLFFI